MVISTTAEMIGGASTVAELMLSAQSDSKSELPVASIPAYCWQVKSRCGGKPSQAWVMRNPELNPEKQRVCLRCNARLRLPQIEQIGEALVCLAGQIDPAFAEPRVYKKHAGARYWQPSWPAKVNITLHGGSELPVALEGDHALHPKMAWEIGSHLLQIALQNSLPR